MSLSGLLQEFRAADREVEAAFGQRITCSKSTRILCTQILTQRFVECFPVDLFFLSFFYKQECKGATSKPRTNNFLPSMEEVDRVELVTFSCRECVVYMIPPASTVGHRAELWDVENPLQVAGQTPCRFRTLLHLV